MSKEYIKSPGESLKKSLFRPSSGLTHGGSNFLNVGVEFENPITLKIVKRITHQRKQIDKRLDASKYLAPCQARG